MKDWQHGIELDRLLELEAQYAPFNKYSESPFSGMKKNVIAEKYHTGELVIIDPDGTMLCERTAKVASNYTMFPNTIIAQKNPGDTIISKIVFTESSRQYVIRHIMETTGPIWLELWQEDPEQIKIAFECGFKYVGSKISTFGEIIGIYFKEPNSFFGERDFPVLEEWQFKPMLQFVSPVIDVSTIVEKVKSMKFANHYSNYNAGNNWGALSLRGFSPDPSMIAKPSEMNKKWLEKHKNENFFIQDTKLFDEFPEVRTILDKYPGEKERVRFMRLTPGGGELQRHTDQVDKDSGWADGKLLRLHIPIITNPKVEFITWNTKGEKLIVNPKVGESWSLNTMYPHMVVNNGDTDRIHLVTDIVSSKELRDMLVQ